MNTTDNQIKVLTAFKMGKAIEVLCENDTWKEIKEEVADFYPFNFATETYRVKPTLRPYKSAAEFLAAQQQHGPFIDATPTQSGSYYDMPISVGLDSVAFTHFAKSFSEITGFHWQDGTPCGIEEELK